MRRTSLAPHRRRAGVSEVLGALLLIIVVVTAVASLSVFLSQAQTNAQARDALLTSVKDENLQISNAIFSLGTNSTQVWNTTTISIHNVNTAESGLYQIQVNGNWLSDWEEVGLSDRALNPVVIGHADTTAIVIPARATVNFNLSIYHLGIPRNESVKIVLMSEAGNFFTTEYLTPTAISTSSTLAENYQTVTRDIVSFDGSQSYSVNSSIQSYSWQISIPKPTPSGGCNETALNKPGEFVSSTVSGETVQYLPESLFAPEISSPCIMGPLQVALTVTDTDGLQSASQPTIISQDPSIAPASGLTYSVRNTNATFLTVLVKVNDIFEQPLAGEPVSATIAAGQGVSNLTSPAFNDTAGYPDPYATFSFNYSGPFTAEFESGTLPPIYVNLG
jgi:hypothetical protein